MSKASTDCLNNKVQLRFTSVGLWPYLLINHQSVISEKTSHPSSERDNTMDPLHTLPEAHHLTALEATLMGLPVYVGCQLLPDGILVRAARRFLHDTQDVLHLALASKSLWGDLLPEVYITDVANVKEKERKMLASVPFPKLPDPSLTLDFLMETSLKAIPEASTRLRLFRHRPNVRGKVTALHHAAINGSTSVARRAIDASTKMWPGYLDVKCRGCSPLLMALMFDQIDIIRLLVEGGCFVDTWHNEPKAARKFVPGGCEFVKDLEVRNRHFNKTNVVYSPLSYAISQRRPHQALLLANSTNDSGLVPDFKNKPPVLSLHLAAFAGMAPVVRTLLERGYDKSAPSSVFCGATPSEMAIMGVDDNTAVMHMLLDKSAFYSTVASPWNEALIHRAPQNAIFLLSLQHQYRKLSNLTCEVQYCLETDQLLPALKWIIENDRSPTICQYVHDMCHKLIDSKVGIGSATMRFLREKHIMERPLKRIELADNDAKSQP